MEIEKIGYNHFYSFSRGERYYVAKGLSKVVSELKQKIKRIENNPKNEGQAHYLEAISNLEFDIQELTRIIKIIK